MSDNIASRPARRPLKITEHNQGDELDQQEQLINPAQIIIDIVDPNATSKMIEDIDAKEAQDTDYDGPGRRQ